MHSVSAEQPIDQLLPSRPSSKVAINFLNKFVECCVLIVRFVVLMLFLTFVVNVFSLHDVTCDMLHEAMSVNIHSIF
jgi:hypothetical protein